MLRKYTRTLLAYFCVAAAAFIVVKGAQLLAAQAIHDRIGWTLTRPCDTAGYCAPEKSR